MKADESCGAANRDSTAAGGSAPLRAATVRVKAGCPEVDPAPGRFLPRLGGDVLMAAGGCNK